MEEKNFEEDEKKLLTPDQLLSKLKLLNHPDHEAINATTLALINRAGLMENLLSYTLMKSDTREINIALKNLFNEVGHLVPIVTDRADGIFKVNIYDVRKNKVIPPQKTI